jgi:hypothetical protein
MDDKSCIKCKWWLPKYFGVGTCVREGAAYAKHWVSDDSKQLLTATSFGCVEYEPVPSVDKDTL